MPYIEKKDRAKFNDIIFYDIDKIGNLCDTYFVHDVDEIGNLCDTCGELNYVITRICDAYFRNQGGRYQQINDIVGALEGAKLEFYRRIASTYEDIKIEKNGDAYDA